jgi:peptidyl-tRNA hydrolase, PTH1 family
VIVGLGNPGRDYELTRHNAGAMALDVLVDRTASALKRHRSGCLVAQARLGGRAVVLARPLSYMNDSGPALRRTMDWFKVAATELVVLHDDLDIPFGQVRVKHGGGTAGHNGLSSLVSHLGTRDFGRVRIGISRPPGRRDPVDWVLTRFSAAEREELPLVLERAAAAAERIVEAGVEDAMNEFNVRP